MASNYRLPLTKTTPIGWMHSIGIVTKIGGKEKEAEKPLMSKQENYLAQQEAARLKAIEDEKQAKLAAEEALKAKIIAEETEKARLRAENLAKEAADYKAKMAARAAALDKATMPDAPIVVSEEIKKVLEQNGLERFAIPIGYLQSQTEKIIYIQA